MRELDRKLRGRFVVSRTDVLDAGGSDDSIKMRVGNGWWSPLHPGVYRVGPPSGEWIERLSAAVLAAGPTALISHRSAFVLWGLDGINAQLVELTVPYAQAPVPAGVIRHRTRRIMPRAMLHGLPVMGLERTLLDVAPLVPVAVLAKGVDSALRLALTDPTAISKTVSEQGGPGVRGVRRLERVLSALENTGPTGSPAELDLLMGMRREGIPMPTLQWEIKTRSGQHYRVDFGWPGLGKVVEVDGLDAHSGPDNLDRDLVRQNALLDMGLQIRRYTARSIRHNLDGVVSSIAEFLAS